MVRAKCVVEVAYQFVEPNLTLFAYGNCADNWIELSEEDGWFTLTDECLSLSESGNISSKTSNFDIMTYPDLFQATELIIQWMEKLNPSF